MWELRGCMEKKARDQVEIFYRKWNKGKWDETKSEGKLVVASGYAGMRGCVTVLEGS